MSLPVASRLLRTALRTPVVPAVKYSSKRIKATHHISGVEQAFAMSVLFATILGPSCWVLSHLEDYKKKN